MSKSYRVKMTCKVKKEVITEGCTEDQARENPWEYAVDEREIEQVDWEVDDVELND